MASAYQPTTEHRESQESIGITCNPTRWSGRRKGQDLPKVRVTEEGGSQTKDNKTDTSQRFFKSCMKPTNTADLTPSGSIASLATPTFENPSEKGSTTKLERAKTFKKKIVKSTEQFFGVCDEEEQCQLERKWTQRKKRHYNKRYGGIADVVEDAVDAARKRPGRMPSVSSEHSVASSQYDPSLVRTRSRRQSVASMAWKQLKYRAKAGTLVAEASKGPPITTIHEGGRSFCPAMIADIEEDEVDSAFTHEEAQISARDVDDEVFFNFISERVRKGKKELPLPPIPEDKDVCADEEASQRESDEEKEPLTPGGDEVDSAPWLGPKVAGQPNVRGKRMVGRPDLKNANRREIGKGLVGRWLNRTIKRKRLPSTVKKQLENLNDHRPYFTYWVSFVQVVVLIVTLAVYKFAPIGFTKTERTELILKSRQGTLVREYRSTYDQDNFWIGPNQEALIHLGAKFAPCMRNDKLLIDALEREQLVESRTGCCIKTDNSGCIQSSNKDCSRAFTNFKKFSKDNASRAVCGQDPHLCLNPTSIKPHAWNLWDITKWPTCKKSDTVNISGSDFPHMTCEVTGRPCCIKTQAKCAILSRQECKFLHGYYHENATLCSQVDCLKSICGMIPFVTPRIADQIYRLWMAIFLHAGVIHLACTLVFNFTILRDLERLSGWIRTAIIYIFSGIGGYLISAILIPYQVEVGPSGSMFGIIACLFVELIQSWQIINRPIVALFKLCGLVFLLLLVGLLPYVDNFAHMAGFVFGFCLAFIFLPYITFGVWDKRRKRIQILVAFAAVIIMYAVGFIVFLESQTTTCVGCEYLNCVPFTVDFCEPYNLGQKLQPR